MHKPEPILENINHNILWEFEMEANHLIPTRRPDLALSNMKKELQWITELKSMKAKR